MRRLSGLGGSVLQFSTRLCTNENDQEDIEEGMKMLKEVAYVGAVEKGGIADSATDESCWPVGQGDAYPTLEKLRTASGGEMRHHGEKHVTFRYRGRVNKDPVGLKFQVTDVKKPLFAVRRLVEKGNVVVLSDVGGES